MGVEQKELDELAAVYGGRQIGLARVCKEVEERVWGSTRQEG